MTRKRFTDQEKQELLKNPNILKIGDCSITYNPDFRIQAVKAYKDGKSPMQVFIEAGFDLKLLGKKQPEYCLKRWRKIFNKSGINGLLSEARGTGKGGGRPKTKPLSLEEEVKQLKAKNALLEAENEFLKKLKALERGLI